MKLHRLTVVVNPTSGKKRGLVVLDRVKPIFNDAGIELDVRATQHHGHASEIARTVDLKTTDGICVIGGDGTFHEVADGLMQREEPISIPLGIIYQLHRREMETAWDDALYGSHTLAGPASKAASSEAGS